MLASKSSIRNYRKQQEKDSRIAKRLREKFQKAFPFFTPQKPAKKKTHKQRRIEKLIVRGVIEARN